MPSARLPRPSRRCVYYPGERSELQRDSQACPPLVSLHRLHLTASIDRTRRVSHSQPLAAQGSTFGIWFMLLIHPQNS